MAASFSVSQALRDHTFADAVISGHGTDAAVFDTRNLTVLKSFIDQMSPDNRDAVLEARGLLDEPGASPGTKAREHGDLSAMLVARFGHDVDQRLTDAEWERMRQWFDSGIDITHE